MEHLIKTSQIVGKRFWWFAAAVGVLAGSLAVTVIFAVTPVSSGNVPGAPQHGDYRVADRCRRLEAAGEPGRPLSLRPP